MRLNWLFRRRPRDVATGTITAHAGRPEPRDLNRPPDASPASALNAFATRMLSALPAADAHALSPQNLGLALAMVARGAAGHTLAELHAALSIGDQAGALERLADRLQAVRAEALPARLESVAGVWPDRTVVVDPAFLADMRSRYQADVRWMDFNEPEAVAAAVNRWAFEHTGGHIAEVVSPGAVPRPPGVLVSTAFFFQGMWADPFDRRATLRAPFHAPGGDVSVWLMEQTSRLQYADTGDLQVVRIPYVGGCCLTVILPGPGRLLTQAIDQLGQPGSLQTLTSRASLQPVRLALPRIEIDSGIVSMRGVLQALGAASLFTRQADLGRMTAMTPAWVSDVVHRATLAVDETGTVARAATVAHGLCTASRESERVRPVEMRVDRPYLMLLQMSRDGSILFAASVTRPPSV